MHQFGSPVRSHSLVLAAARADGTSVLIARKTRQKICIWFKRERFSPFEPIQGTLLSFVLRSGDNINLGRCGRARFGARSARLSKIYISNRKFINNAITCLVQAGKMRPNYGSLPQLHVLLYSAMKLRGGTVNLSPLPFSLTTWAGQFSFKDNMRTRCAANVRSCLLSH